MIITCEKCGTRFNLDESLLDADGSTVRCSRCRYIFTAFPPFPEPEFDDPGFEDTDFNQSEDTLPDAFQDTFDLEKLELEEIDPDEIEIPGADTAAEPPLDPDHSDEFDLPGPRDYTENPDQSDPQEHISSMDVDETDGFTPGEQGVKERGDLEGTTPSEPPPHDPPPPRRPARASLAQTLGPQDEVIGEVDTPPQKKSRIGLPVMLLLILFLVAVGGYVGATFLGYKIPFLPDIQIPLIQKYLPEKAPESVTYPEPVPDQKSVTGRFLTNDTSGELFIITGKIENPAQIPYRRIQVKGTLFQKEKKPVMSQVAFCGNIIPEETLKTGPVNDLITQLKTPAESTGNIMPGGTIPFMLIFTDLPRNLENFTVEVAGFENSIP